MIHQRAYWSSSIGTRTRRSPGGRSDASASVPFSQKSFSLALRLWLWVPSIENNGHRCARYFFDFTYLFLTFPGTRSAPGCYRRPIVRPCASVHRLPRFYLLLFPTLHFPRHTFRLSRFSFRFALGSVRVV